MDSIYLTEQGDKWDFISYKVYGTSSHVNELLKANPELIEYYIFPAGIEVIIPDLAIEQTALSALPPWRQQL